MKIVKKYIQNIERDEFGNIESDITDELVFYYADEGKIFLRKSDKKITSTCILMGTNDCIENYEEIPYKS